MFQLSRCHLHDKAYSQHLHHNDFTSNSIIKCLHTSSLTLQSLSNPQKAENTKVIDQGSSSSLDKPPQPPDEEDCCMSGSVF